MKITSLDPCSSYYDLANLVDKNSKFRATIETLNNGRVFTTFTHDDSATYEDFFCSHAPNLLPLEANGICFDTTGVNEGIISIASRPAQKIFYLGENPTVRSIEEEDLFEVQILEEGSTFSSGLWREGSKQGIFIKSKEGITTPEAEELSRALEENHNLLGSYIKVVSSMRTFGSTVILRKTTCTEKPIVIAGIRDNLTGIYSQDWNAHYPVGEKVTERIFSLYGRKSIRIPSQGSKREFLNKLSMEGGGKDYLCKFRNTEGRVAQALLKSLTANQVILLENLKEIPGFEALLEPGNTTLPLSPPAPVE